MLGHFSSEANKVLALANDAARGFNHAYIGTEHILLALMDANSTAPSHVLVVFDITADKVRAEIGRVVTRGPEAVVARSLPLTPRARRAIEHARQEAFLMNEQCIGPEHLFLGLVSEPAGVACQVLLNLGVRPTDLRKEVFKVRMAQMKFVERAIRPVRASTLRKRKMREELLAHFVATYDQELARLHEPAAALKAAAERFGDPADLAQELQSSLPAHERVSHFVERFLEYRAPESAARFSFRMAKHTFVVLAATLSLTTIAVFLRYGWTAEVSTLSRVLTAITFATPPAQYIIWLAYIKLRDALWGVFGSRKSPLRVIVLDALIAAVGATYLFTITVVTRLNVFDMTREVLWTCAWMSSLAAAALLVLALKSGPSEIRDTQFALLDIAD